MKTHPLDGGSKRTHVHLGLPTFPIFDSMRLDQRSPEEYEWLLQHGQFHSDLYQYLRITKGGEDYVLDAVDDSKGKVQRIGTFTCLEELCAMQKLDISLFRWFHKPLPHTT